MKSGFLYGKEHEHIHKTLKKHSPHGVHKAKRLLAFKYPKLVLLAAVIILSYYLFTLPSIKFFVSALGQFKYISDFIAGIFFTFGFTTPLSIGFFIVSTPTNILLSTVIASVGSVIGNMIIFKTIKFSLMDEFNELEKKNIIKKIKKIIEKNKNILIRHYLIYIFAGFILATPIPDEVGVSMLAGLTTINLRNFAVISFILHAIPIFLIFSFSA